MSLTNNERRDVIDRLSPREEMAAILVEAGSGTPTAKVVVRNWVCNPAESHDDRRYTCPSCGRMVTIRGVVPRISESCAGVRGIVACCDEFITDYVRAPRRRRRWRCEPGCARCAAADSAPPASTAVDEPAP